MYSTSILVKISPQHQPHNAFMMPWQIYKSQTSNILFMLQYVRGDNTGDTSTSMALETCRKTVLRPYYIYMKMVSWAALQLLICINCFDLKDFIFYMWWHWNSIKFAKHIISRKHEDMTKDVHVELLAI